MNYDKDLLSNQITKAFYKLEKKILEDMLLMKTSLSILIGMSKLLCEIISNSIKVIERTSFLYGKLQRGIIPQKNVGEATVVNLCMSSGHALYLC